MLKNFEDLKKLASGTKKTIAVVDADTTAIEAIKEAEEFGIKCIYLGDKDAIIRNLESLNMNYGEGDIIQADSEEAALKAVNLVKEGKADILMKGKLATATLLKAVLNKETGINQGVTMSHLTALSLKTYDKLLFVTDAGMNPYPNLEQKKDITENTIGFLQKLGYDEIKIAALTAVETVSPKMPETEEAAALKDHFSKRDGINFEGPFAMDLAISKEAASKKGIDSQVSGDVDVLVVPNIAVGNIMCKSLIYLANATMAGLVLGAKAPIILVSRGASSEEKLMSILLALV
ncbi:MAG: phosphate acyltransferase [Defluviitaleaceae bacterium]|nr:phosphate acyltransferase [Defluviitaleaceae bacterium]